MASNRSQAAGVSGQSDSGALYSTSTLQRSGQVDPVSTDTGDKRQIASLWRELDKKQSTLDQKHQELLGAQAAIAGMQNTVNAVVNLLRIANEEKLAIVTKLEAAQQETVAKLEALQQELVRLRSQQQQQQQQINTPIRGRKRTTMQNINPFASNTASPAPTLSITPITGISSMDSIISSTPSFTQSSSTPDMVDDSMSLPNVSSNHLQNSGQVSSLHHGDSAASSRNNPNNSSVSETTSDAVRRQVCNSIMKMFDNEQSISDILHCSTDTNGNTFYQHIRRELLTVEADGANAEVATATDESPIPINKERSGAALILSLLEFVKYDNETPILARALPTDSVLDLLYQFISTLEPAIKNYCANAGDIDLEMLRDVARSTLYNPRFHGLSSKASQSRNVRHIARACQQTPLMECLVLFSACIYNGLITNSLSIDGYDDLIYKKMNMGKKAVQSRPGEMHNLAFKTLILETAAANYQHNCFQELHPLLRQLKVVLTCANEIRRKKIDNDDLFQELYTKYKDQIEAINSASLGSIPDLSMDAAISNTDVEDAVVDTNVDADIDDDDDDDGDGDGDGDIDVNTVTGPPNKQRRILSGSTSRGGRGGGGSVGTRRRSSRIANTGKSN
ncbi:hypothetical protein GQ42DRAFT_165951 [Ramicandelaber brevisporus]|nr:hypothetical protein GQ42DRAFT_165951 [Ramicandelaber brevisporus]